MLVNGWKDLEQHVIDTAVATSADSVCPWKDILNTTNKQESHAIASIPRDAAAVVFGKFGLKFANNIHYKFNSSQASKGFRAPNYRRKTEFNSKWPF